MIEDIFNKKLFNHIKYKTDMSISISEIIKSDRRGTAAPMISLQSNNDVKESGDAPPKVELMENLLEIYHRKKISTKKKKRDMIRLFEDAFEDIFCGDNDEHLLE